MAKAKWNISTREGRIQYIHGLAQAAAKIAKEERERQQNDKDIEFRFGANLISKRRKKVN